MKYLAYLLLILTIGFNLWLYYPETQILADPNDNIFQFSLVGRTSWIWENYGCPRSFSCLPNLIDHNVPNWAEGYPLPFYYSHVPQIATVATYNLIIKPLITQLLNYPITLYQYYNWTKYLLLSFFPLSVFLALRIVGFSPILSALAAFFGANFSTDGLYGIDSPSYLWRGYGLTSQLYAIVFIPLAIAFTYRALVNTSFWQASETSASRIRKGFWSPLRFALSPQNDNYHLYAVLFLTLTTAGHLGIGIIGILSTIPFLFFDIKPRNIFLRAKKLFLILTSLFLILSYWIIPILLNNRYHIISFWDPIWKFNSYGWYEVVKQFWSGEIFDWQRLSIITTLVVIGFFALLVRSQRHSGESRLDRDDSRIPTRSWTSLPAQAGQDDNWYVFALLFAFWMIFYFGRTTWGGLIDLIPAMGDFHQHRFIVGVHVAALFLIPAGIDYLFQTAFAVSSKIRAVGSDFARNTKASNLNIIFYIIIFIFASLLIYFTAKQTVTYASLNNKWIYQANDAYRYDEDNLKKTLARIDSSDKGRIYAGRPGNWGKSFRLGSTELYLLLGGIGYDISQFLPETWSPLSENEQNFDEREVLDYDLLNIRHVISPKNQGFSPAVKLTEKYGPFELYTVPTTGWFDVVTSPMLVKSDKTNYINTVHLWWNSYVRRWKMHPLISVEKNPNIPQGIQKVIEMKDEVTYQLLDQRPTANGQRLNIFSDFPFVFPEATVSGKIKEESVSKQTYAAKIDVPDNCKQCYVMFKMSFHPDWQVKVDGKEAQKFALFPFYLATPVSSGTHTVEFTYQPNRLKVILLVGEIIAGIIVLLLRKKIRVYF